jgi:hypothetical protein
MTSPWGWQFISETCIRVYVYTWHIILYNSCAFGPCSLIVSQSASQSASHTLFSVLPLHLKHNLYLKYYKICCPSHKMRNVLFPFNTEIKTRKSYRNLIWTNSWQLHTIQTKSNIKTIISDLIGMFICKSPCVDVRLIYGNINVMLRDKIGFISNRISNSTF